MGKRALTLIEIIVSIVVLAMVVTGLTQVFLSARKFSIHSRSRAAALQVGRMMLDYLPAYVNMSAWNQTGNPLNASEASRYCDSDGEHEQQPGCPPVGDRTINGIVYTGQYNVTDAVNSRRVTLNIFWNEKTAQ